MLGPVARIIPRYVAGYLLLKQIIPQEIADMIARDPDIALAVGAAMSAAAEGAYVLAKRLGWTT